MGRPRADIRAATLSCDKTDKSDKSAALAQRDSYTTHAADLITVLDATATKYPVGRRLRPLPLTTYCTFYCT